jgi:hypothetical protein
MKFYVSVLFAVAIAASNNANAQYRPDTVGWTQYDMQSNGSSGNRVALDTSGGVHFTWMKADPYPSVRGVAYNYRNPSGNWLGTMIIRQNGSGYPQLALTTDNRAVIGFHRGTSGAESLYCAVDFQSGYGLFDIYGPPNSLGSRRHIWPYVAADIHDRIHLIASRVGGSFGEPLQLIYTRSDNGGTTWVAPQAVDTLMMLSAIVTSSRLSDKVAIVYTHPADTLSQLTNDVYYVQSLDGITWDFTGGKINVTSYANDNDSLWAFNDCDAVYDYNDNLHIIWSSQRVINFGADHSTNLFHYASGVISTITEGYAEWPESGCDFGTGDMQICKMSLGAHQHSNNLYAIYTRFDTSDCSAIGYANGEIHMQYSANGGADWSIPRNLTNSPTPGCPAGDCRSEHWASMAEVVDDYLHIFYVVDLDAGSIPHSEGSVTDNPMIYRAWPNPQVGVRDDVKTPANLLLRPNYPNPFNATTVIEFETASAIFATLSIFDLAGRKVSTLLSYKIGAGLHKVTWDAGSYSSGVYLCRLQAGEKTESAKLILVK